MRVHVGRGFEETLQVILNLSRACHKSNQARRTWNTECEFHQKGIQIELVTFFFGGSFGTKTPPVPDEASCACVVGDCLFLSNTCASLCGRSGGVCHEGAKWCAIKRYILICCVEFEIREHCRKVPPMWCAPRGFFREGLSTSLEAVVSAVSSMRDAKASEPIDSATAKGAAF